MNKTTKIWLNYVLGSIVCVLLLWGVWAQVSKQLHTVNLDTVWETGPMYLFWVCVALMPLNLLLEAKKWHLLAGYAQPLTYKQALASFFAGSAFSIVTPNRLGDYPGRLLYLSRKNTLRLIGVSFLGAIAQMLTAFMYGLAGLVYYNMKFPGTVQGVVLISCAIITIIIAVVYWKFSVWMPLIEKIKWLKRYNVYARLLENITAKKQLTILIISLARYAIYTAQYLILLYWMKVSMPVAGGFLICGLFFWLIGVIPSLALVELGERSQVGLYLFHHFSDNTVGILTATISVWAINLVLPAILGSILLLKARYVR